ncbi:MAG: hypothetical protein GY774_04845 [Planctomycetes bacterium]|nr:hypothetical protein [Planctomycetota bacterium]
MSKNKHVFCGRKTHVDFCAKMPRSVTSKRRRAKSIPAPTVTDILATGSRIRTDKMERKAVRSEMRRRVTSLTRWMKADCPNRLI